MCNVVCVCAVTTGAFAVVATTLFRLDNPALFRDFSHSLFTVSKNYKEQWFVILHLHPLAYLQSITHALPLGQGVDALFCYSS